MNNKTTVTTLNVSVGADNGQSQSVTKHSNSITDNNCVRNLQSTGTPVGENLETVSMEELYDTVYPIKKPLVEDLIYNGVYLFVGAPKVGKSFLMAEIGFCVSAGIDLWGHKTNQGRCQGTRITQKVKWHLQKKRGKSTDRNILKPLECTGTLDGSNSLQHK